MKQLPLVLLVGAAGVGKDTSAELIQDLYGAESVFVTASAKPLKELARSIFFFNNDQLYGPSENRNQIDPRFVPYSEGWNFLMMDNPMNPLESSRLATQLCDWATRSYDYNKALKVSMEVATLLRNESMTAGGLSPRVVLQILGTEFGRALDRNIWIKQSSDAGVQALEDGKWISIITDGRFLNEVFTVKKAGGMVIKLCGDSTIQSGHQSEMEIAKIPQTLIDYTIYNRKVNGKEYLKDCLEQIFYPLTSSRIISYSKYNESFGE